LGKDAVDVVVAGRHNRDRISDVRSVLARVARGYLSLLSRMLTNGQAPRDVNSGFFAASRSAAEVLNGFQFERYPEPQMYVLACRRGLRLAEIAIEQLAREHGISSLTLGHAVRLTYRFSVFVLAELLQHSRVQ